MINPFFLLMRWVQTVPIAMLMLAPFEDGVLRVRRRAGWLFSVSYMLLTGVLLAVVSPMSSIDGQRNIIARDLGMAAVLVCYFFWWGSTIRAPAAHKLLTTALMLHYAAFLNAASNMVSSLILGENFMEKINGEAGCLVFDLCLLASTVITWPLVWYFLRHVLQKNLPVLDDRQIRRGLSYMCVIFLMFAVVTYNPPYEKPEMFVVIVAMAVTDMLAYYIFFQEIGIAHRQEAALRMFESYQMQYQEIINRVEEVRRLRHDMRHHLTTLGALNAQGKQAEIADYLKQYGSVYDQLEELELCGDPVTGSILSHYLIQAREEGVMVDCNCTLRGDTIDPVDMTVLLGNCLENAMESLRQVPLEERRLDIDVRIIRGEILLLQIINSSAAMSDTEGFVDWEQFPSCKRRGRRGVGLQSVADSAQKYGGSARFQQKDGLFTVRVVLNLP